MFGFIPYKNIQRSAEALPRKEKPVISMITGFSHLWRSGRDSNPRTAFDRHTISSRARYDRFDTTP